MLKKFMLGMKAALINEAKWGLAYIARDAVDRLSEYSQARKPGIFNVEIEGSPAVLSGNFNPQECDRLFASGSLHDDWVAFLSFMAIVRLGAEVSREIGKSNDVIDPVQSKLYPTIEAAFRDRFGLK